MSAPSPRLLVTLEPSTKIAEAARRWIPDVPWAYLDESPPEAWSRVEVLLVGSFNRDQTERFEARFAPSLKFVQRAFTGLDGFPFDRFPSNVQVAGNVGAFAPFVAEHALALALSSGRDLERGREMLREGRLRPVEEPRLLYGSTALVLGFGEIGRELSKRLRGAGAHVQGLNRSGAPSPECERMYSSGQLREAVAQGDFVFEVRPLTKATSRTIGRRELEAMRPKAVFVDVGRAGTVDEQALYDHLRSHPDFRAALDVWWEEDFLGGTVSSRYPFMDLKNFTGTPHCAGRGGGGHDMEARAMNCAFENLARFFRDGRPWHVVDRREYE